MPDATRLGYGVKGPHVHVRRRDNPNGPRPSRGGNFDLRRGAEEREEELAAAREANRRLMAELNKASGARRGRFPPWCPGPVPAGSFRWPRRCPSR